MGTQSPSEIHWRGMPDVPDTKPPEPAASADATLPAPAAGGRQLPPADPRQYALADEVARGGLGRIIRARDQKLDRPVAIKELLAPAEDATARFAREAFLTARLQHPAIVPVYDAGVWPTGSPFYAMKLVSGRSLEAAIRETLTFAERIALLPHVIDVANALAYAHDQRIIHRDLKPANVLVGAFGETVVVDWGLAKDLTTDEPALAAPAPARPTGASRSGAETVEGAVMGTPAYMPPEQALGVAVDERADVYAIGAMLYHVLAGEPAFAGTSSQDVLLKVIHDPPEPIEERAPETPPDLAAIVRKAMARRPADRYPTAGELAEDLRRFQTGQLVEAHRYGTLEIIGRWLRRHKAAFVVAAGMLAAGVVLSVVGVRRVLTERDRARAAQQRAERAQAEADSRGDELALVQAAMELDRDPRTALAWMKRLSASFDDWPTARLVALEALKRGYAWRVWRADDKLGGAAGLRAGVAASPDGKLVLLSWAGVASRGEIDERRLIDVSSGQMRRLGGTVKDEVGDPTVVTFTPDGADVIFAGADGSVGIWNVATAAARELRGHTETVTAVAAGKRFLVSGDAVGLVRVWYRDRGSWPTEWVMEWTQSAGITAVALGPARNVVAAGSEDGALRVVTMGDDAGTAAAIGTNRRDPAQRLAAHSGPVTALTFLDADKLASAGRDGHVKVWDVNTGALLGDFAGDGSTITALAVRSEGALLAAGSVTGKLWLWEGWRAEAPRPLDGHSQGITSLAFAGRSLVSASTDRTVREWDPDAPRAGVARILRGHEAEVVQVVAVGPDGSLATAGADRTVRLWRPAAADQPPEGPALREWLARATDAKVEE